LINPIHTTKEENSMRKKGKKNIKEDRMLKISDLLIAGENPRTIANKLGVDLGVVYSTKNKLTSEGKINSSNNEVVTDVEENAEVENTSEPVEVVEEPKKKKRYTEEEMLEIYLYTEEHSQKETIEKFGCAQSTVHRAILYFGGNIRKKGRLDVQNQQEIYDYCRKQNHTFKDASNKFGCAISTVSRAIKAVEATMSTTEVEVETEPVVDIKDETKLDVVKEEPVVVEEVAASKYVEVEKGTTLFCTTFKNRHPVPSYCIPIFDRVDVEDVFDFTKLDSEITQFFLENIKFEDGIPDRDIVCYMTGFQPVAGALAKICNVLKLNLTFMHHGKSDDIWKAQQIFTEFPQKRNIALSFLGDFKKIFLHGITIDQLHEKEEVYAVTKNFFNSNAGLTERWMYISADMEDGWQVFADLGMEININKKDLQSVVLYPVLLKENNDGTIGWKFKASIAKSYNFKYN
jgi:transposase